MLRNDHSIQILDGIFKKVINTKPENPQDLEDYTKWEYLPKPMTFPTGNANDEDTRIYIGLFTEEPDDNGENFKEPGPALPEGASWSSQEWWPEYCRVRIDNKSRLKRVNFLSEASTYLDEVTYKDTGDKVYAAVVKNQDMILFPEAIGESLENPAGWGLVKGFGLFYSADQRAKDGQPNKPFLWGRIKTAAQGPDEYGVQIGCEKVPVIRENSLEISLV